MSSAVGTEAEWPIRPVIAERGKAFPFTPQALIIETHGECSDGESAPNVVGAADSGQGH